MPRSWISALVTGLFGLAFLICPSASWAQRHGGGGAAGPNTGGGIDAVTHPDGVVERDTIKNFHQLMAVQATSEQAAEFQALRKLSEAAQAQLQTILQQLHQNPAIAPVPHDALDRALDAVRTGTQKFQQGFSPEQKNGLKDFGKRLSKADSDLEQEQKRLDQSLDVKAAPADIELRAQTLDKSLTEFANQQLALGREMSITLATGQDVAFTLPRVKTSAVVGQLTIPVTISGALSQISSEAGQRKFQLQMLADLTDLQQNITLVLRDQFDSSATCGQRIAIRQATLTPATPAGLLVVRLHFERWFCAPGAGRQSPTELGEFDGTLEINLTAAENPTGLQVKGTLGRINADGRLGDELRSGSLGEDLRDKSAAAVLSAAKAAGDFNSALPPALRSHATIQSAKFRDVGIGGLAVQLEGHVEISDAQADELAKQLNQSLSNQASTQSVSAPGTPAQ